MIGVDYAVAEDIHVRDACDLIDRLADRMESAYTAGDLVEAMVCVMLLDHLHHRAVTIRDTRSN